ncbi:Protein of unknown function [Pyronema omphalodes CBS 100304]|uniref:Uncharacterized protein n=1 Tax=Pyronema omphalodes (strain CBS 100304) TaxID=1076935 RepID=U4LTK0_PYROM|nr:Protein of unknown function [Pyronema omphalodes CBS 100304]
MSIKGSPVPRVHLQIVHLPTVYHYHYTFTHILIQFNANRNQHHAFRIQFYSCSI